MEEDLRRILDAGLAATDPKAVVLRSLKLDGDRILAGGESFEPERVFVLSAGKPACAMARATEELLGDRIFGGLIATKEGHEAPLGSLETSLPPIPSPTRRRLRTGSWGARAGPSLEAAPIATETPTYKWGTGCFIIREVTKLSDEGAKARSRSANVPHRADLGAARSYTAGVINIDPTAGCKEVSQCRR